MDVKSILMGKCRGTLSDFPSYLMGDGSGTGYTRTDIERTFSRSASAGGVSIKPHGRAIVKAVRGNTVVWNQLINNGDFEDTSSWSGLSATLSVNDNIGTITYDGSTWGAIVQRNIKITANNKYLFVFDVKSVNDSFSIPISVLVYDGSTIRSTPHRITNEWVNISEILTASNSISNGQFQFARTEGTPLVNEQLQVKNCMVFDLTQMFGAGNEPTVEEFRAMYPQLYYPKSEPKLIHFKGDGILSYDTNGNVVGSCPIPTDIFFPDGMKAAGAVYDELLPNKAIKRIGVVNLGDLNWLYNSSNTEFYTDTISSFPDVPIEIPANALCSLYAAKDWRYVYSQRGTAATGIMAIDDSKKLHVKNSNYTSASAFKSAMSGIMLCYELAEPIETAINPPLYLSYIVDNGGEEEVTVKTGVTKTAPFSGVVEYSVSDAADVCPASKGGEK